MLKHASGNGWPRVDAEAGFRIGLRETNDILARWYVIVLRIKADDAQQSLRSEIDLDVSSERVAICALAGPTERLATEKRIEASFHPAGRFVVEACDTRTHAGRDLTADCTLEFASPEVSELCFGVAVQP